MLSGVSYLPLGLKVTQEVDTGGQVSVAHAGCGFQGWQGREGNAQKVRCYVKRRNPVIDPDSTDASSIEDNEDVYNMASLENCTAK